MIAFQKGGGAIALIIKRHEHSDEREGHYGSPKGTPDSYHKRGFAV